eukprot:2785757-Alexandrium_andersonii.AAC.1
MPDCQTSRHTKNPIPGVQSSGSSGASFRARAKEKATSLVGALGPCPSTGGLLSSASAWNRGSSPMK